MLHFANLEKALLCSGGPVLSLLHRTDQKCPLWFRVFKAFLHQHRSPSYFPAVYHPKIYWGGKTPFKHLQLPEYSWESSN